MNESIVIIIISICAIVALAIIVLVACNIFKCIYSSSMRDHLLETVKWFFRGIKGRSGLLRFYDQFKTDFNSFPNKDPHFINELATLDNDVAANGINWDHVHRIESILVRSAPDKRLMAYIPHLRLRYHALATADQYRAYDDYISKSGSDIDLREDAQYLLSQLQIMRILNSQYCESRRLILRFMATMIFLILLLIFLSSLFKAPLTLFIFSAGMMGAFFSSSSRMSSVVFDQTYISNYQQTGRFVETFIINVIFSMMQGGLAALILWMMVLAKLLDGGIFPQASPLFDQGAETTGPKMLEYFCNAHPDNYRGYAGLFFWSLVAGFCERLVPDLITVYGKKAQDQAQGNGGIMPNLVPGLPGANGPGGAREPGGSGAPGGQGAPGRGAQGTGDGSPAPGGAAAKDGAAAAAHGNPAADDAVPILPISSQATREDAGVDKISGKQGPAGTVDEVGKGKA